MKRTLIALSLTALAGFIFTGCESTPKDTGAYVPINTTINDAENHVPVVLMDKRVQVSVTCSGVYQKTLPDGRMDVVANIRNREEREARIGTGAERLGVLEGAIAVAQ